MAIVTGTLTVNTAFLREIKDDNQHLQELLATLHELTGNPSAACNQSQRIVELLGELRDQLAFHFALEEAYGYFDDAIDAAPRVAERADQLRAEHAILYESACNIAESAQEWHMQRVFHHNSSGDVRGNGTARAPSFRRILIQFQQFRDQLAQHEQNENSLILEALDTDIGGEG